MTSVVTIEEINAACRLDLQTDGGSPAEWNDDRLPEVEMKLAQAEDIVRAYLKVEASSWPPDDPFPEKWKASIIFAFQALFDDKQEWLDGLHADKPTGPIAACLRFDRVPTVA